MTKPRKSFLPPAFVGAALVIVIVGLFAMIFYDKQPEAAMGLLAMAVKTLSSIAASQGGDADAGTEPEEAPPDAE